MTPPLTDAEALAAARRLRLRRPDDVLNPAHRLVRQVVELADAALRQIHAERTRLAVQCGKQRAAGE